MDCFTRDRVLGTGNFATVFSGTDRRTKQPVAVKLLQLDKSHDWKDVLTELEVMRQIHHPNLVALIDVAQSGTRLQIVMELAEMGTLTALIQITKTIPEDVAAVAFFQLCAGLNHLHELGWVHQDVKSSNILFKADGTVKLCDFGVCQPVASRGRAATMADTSREGWRAWFPAVDKPDSERSASSSGGNSQQPSFAGTPYYMAPEVIAKRLTELTPASDIWSAGIVWIEMLTGTYPHHDLHPLKAMVLIAKEAPPRLGAPSSSKAQLVAVQCLDLDVKKRPTAAVLMKDKLIAKGNKRKALERFLNKHVMANTAKLDDDDYEYDSGDEDEGNSWKVQPSDWLFL